MKNEESTFDRLMADPEFKNEFEIEYAQFEAQEQLLELMENSKMSVRALADLSGVSKTTVQKFRKGAFEKLNLESVMKISKALGKELQVRLI